MYTELEMKKIREENEKIYNPNKIPKTFTKLINKMDELDIVDTYQKLDMQEYHNLVTQYHDTVSNEKNEDFDQIMAKSDSFRLDRMTYLDYVHTSRAGEVTYKRHNESNVIFVGANYNNISLKNIYKLLNSAKPDLVLIQLKPDHFDDLFNKHLVEKAENINNYIDQLFTK